MQTRINKLKTLFDINEGLCEISFLFDRINVIADDILPDISKKIDLHSKRQAIMLEDTLRVIQIKYDIMYECIQGISELLPGIIQNANSVYSIEEQKANKKQTSF